MEDLEVKNKKEKVKMQPIQALLFFAFVFTVLGVLMFVFYGNAAKALKIFNADRLVNATYVDVQETSMTEVTYGYTYMPYTLVFEFVDSDGTVYRGTDRKYDTEKLARLHLGETKKIRIDGKGNFIDGSITAVKPDGFLIAGIICFGAVILNLLGATVFSEKTRDVLYSIFGVIIGDNHPAVAMVTFVFLIFSFIVGTCFFASGLHGMNGVSKRNEFIENATTVEATFVCIVAERSSGRNTNSLMGWTFRYEYVDNENNDIVYTGETDFVPVRVSQQELMDSHNQHIGKKIEILIDGQGNCMLATATAEDPTDNAVFWTGIGIYAADLCLLIVYLIARFRKAKDKDRIKE